MNRGTFSNQVNEVERLLNNLNLISERNNNPLYRNLTAANFRGLTYQQVWEKCYSERIFDFLFIDDSILQLKAISFRPLNVSYSFLECPYWPLITLEDYIQQQLVVDQDADEYSLLRNYELLTPTKKETITPIRYDYAPLMYTEGLHPASHMHFGYDNHIRIGTRHILRPLSFVLFILRQCYPEKWREFTHGKNAETISRNVCLNLDKVDANYWHALDNWEMKLV